MRAGALKQRIIIEVAQSAPDGYNQLVTTWSTWATVWAELEPLSGKRYMEAQQANSEVSGICRMRYRAGVLSTMRLNFNGRIFQIISIIHPAEEKEELHIYYKEALD